MVFYYSLIKMGNQEIKKQIEKLLGFEIRRRENSVYEQKEKDDLISDILGHKEINEKNYELAKRLILTELKKESKNEIYFIIIYT